MNNLSAYGKKEFITESFANTQKTTHPPSNDIEYNVFTTTNPTNEYNDFAQISLKNLPPQDKAFKVFNDNTPKTPDTSSRDSVYNAFILTNPDNLNNPPVEEETPYANIPSQFLQQIRQKLPENERIPPEPKTASFIESKEPSPLKEKTVHLLPTVQPSEDEKNEQQAVSAYTGGKYVEAIALYQKIAKTSQPDQKKVASIYTNLGICYNSLGQYQKASEYFEKALQIRRSLFGDSHAEVAMVLNNKGVCYGFQGKYQEALALHQEALKIWETSSPEFSLDIASAHNNIGNCFFSLKQYEEAQKAHQKAYDIRQKKIGDSHLDVGSSLNNLGNCYSMQKDPKKALEYFNKALSIYENQGNSADIYLLQNNIASCYRFENNLSQAISFYNKALAKMEKNHPQYASILNNLARCYTAQKEFDQALESYRQALELRIKKFGSSSIEAAHIQDSMGTVYFLKKECGEAKTTFKKAQKVWKKHLPQFKSQLAWSLNSISRCYVSMKQFEKAKKYQQLVRELIIKK